MATNLKDNLNNKKQMDTEYIFIAMDQFIKDIGQMIFSKEKENKHGLMDQNIKVNIKMD